MKIALFILLAILVSAIAYACVELFYAAVDKIHDKWLYNKGKCRDCGGIYKYYTCYDNYELHECTKCGQMICIKKSNTR